jgi:exodeoxyribonuclease VII small subunit
MPKKSAPAADNADEKLTFEEAYRQLEQLVQQMEQGDLPLEASLELNERGQKLVAICQAHLEQAELRVRTLAPGGH